MSEQQSPSPIDEAISRLRRVRRELESVLAERSAYDDDLERRVARCEREIEELKKRDE